MIYNIRNLFIFTFMLLIGQHMMPAASSSSSVAGPSETIYTINQDAFQEFLRHVTDDVFGGVLATYGMDLKKFEKGEYSFDPETDEMLDNNLFGEINKISENTLKIRLKNAFEHAWQKHENEFIEKKSITPMNAITTRAIKEKIGDLITTAFLENEYKKILFWCSCISTADRLSFAFILVNAIRKKFPDPNQRIVFTAFASGKLMQDYVILKLLSSYGYKNLIINLIDLSYTDPIALQKLLNNKKGAHASKQILEHYGLDIASELNRLEDKLGKDERPEHQESLNYFKKLLPHVQVNTFRNMSEYLGMAQNEKNNLKADVITLVDPNLATFEIARFPSESNMLGITNMTLFNAQEPKFKPHMYIALPQEKPIQIYVERNSLEEFDDLSDQLRQDVETVRQLALEYGADKEYTPAFRNALIEQFATFNKKPIQKLLDKNKVLLEQARTGAIGDKQLNTLLQELKITAINLAFKMGHPPLAKLKVIYDNALKQSHTWRIRFGLQVIKNLQHRLDTIKGDAYDLAWYSDAHLAFQQLVREATKDDAIIYLYDADGPDITEIEDFTEYDDEDYEPEPFDLERISRADYLKRDVFTPLIGAQMMNGLGTYFDPDAEPEEIDIIDIEANPYDKISKWSGSMGPYGRLDLKTGELTLSATGQKEKEEGPPTYESDPAESDIDVSMSSSSAGSSSSASDEDWSVTP